jgi:isopentenyldiphosphate isomerase
MAYPPVVVVDENDTEVGLAMLAEVWQKGLYHRIVSVHVMDDQGRMLLQLRPSDAKLFPGCWDQAAGGHVDQGFDYESAARLELEEEIGLKDVRLTTVATYRFNEQDGDRIINQFVRVYLAKISHDTVLTPAEGEVDKLQWFMPAELKTLIAEHPEKLTTGFLHELRAYFLNPPGRT